MVRIRPTAAGIIFFFIPPVLLYKGFSRTDTALLTAGVGLPAIVLLSFIFLLFGIYSLVKTVRISENSTSILPESARINQSIILEANPRRSTFLPGMKLSVHWKLRFGPFKYQTAAPLPVRGTGRAKLLLSRRGEWTAYSFLRAVDPFGFFHFDYPLGVAVKLSVPPLFRFNNVSEVPGRPVAEASAAPRLKEDAEERLERRSYIPGDDPRRIDWKIYARSGEMLVRVGEDAVPNRGRVWIWVVSSGLSAFQKKKQIRRLDLSLESVWALVRQLEDESKEIRIILPGEKQWAGTETGWHRRLARSLPSGKSHFSEWNYPSPGERLWVISHPGDSAGRIAASDAV
ncbi:MAG: DUF58 domain-containing protein, partial [Spirochaetaceae bacterium]|nr:DUF58 domain-containing protein [Spirochaetaceae bacterium]